MRCLGGIINVFHNYNIRNYNKRTAESQEGPKHGLFSPPSPLGWRTLSANEGRRMPTKHRREIMLPAEIVRKHRRDFGESFDSEGTQVLFAIRSAARRINEASNEWLAPFGLTALKLSYLAALHATSDRDMTPNELSALTHSSYASVTQTVDALERAGLVKRQAHQEDRRSTIVKLTPAGAKLFEEAFDLHHRYIASIASALSRSDRKTFLQGLQRLNDVIDNLPNPAIPNSPSTRRKKR
jgi:DNA-binding MarR family transcriptional regulator